MNDKFDPEWDEFAQHQMAQVKAIVKLMDDVAPPRPAPEVDVKLLEQLRYLAIDLDLSGSADAETVWIAYERLGGVR